MKESPFTRKLRKVLGDMMLSVTQVDSLPVREQFRNARVAWRAHLATMYPERVDPAQVQLGRTLLPSLQIDDDFFTTVERAERTDYNQYAIVANEALGNCYQLSRQDMYNLDDDYYLCHQEELTTPVFLLREVQLAFRGGTPQSYTFPADAAYHRLLYARQTPFEEGRKYYYTVSHDPQAFATPGFCAVILDTEFGVPAAYESYDDDFFEGTSPETLAEDRGRIDQLKRLFDHATFRALVYAWKQDEFGEDNVGRVRHRV